MSESALIAGDLYQQLKSHCTKPQVAELIKKAQDVDSSRGLNRSGNMDDLIRNVRKAVDYRIIGIADVRQLLFDCEEHGNQHVFLYKPRNDEAKQTLSDSSTIRDKLLSASGLRKGQIPRYDYQADSLTFVDFRINERVPGWTAKWYGHETRNQVDSHETVVQDDGRVRDVRVISKKIIKTVLVARWCDSGYLEIRIDRKESFATVPRRTPKEILDRLTKVWKELEPAFSSGLVVKWSMFSVGEKLISELASASETGIADQLPFSLGSITFKDKSDGTVALDPKSAQESVHADSGRIELLRSALVGGARAAGLMIRWLPHEDAPNDIKVHYATAIQGNASNELVVAGKTSPEVYEYIFRQIRDRDEKASGT